MLRWRRLLRRVVEGTRYPGGRYVAIGKLPDGRWAVGTGSDHTGQSERSYHDGEATAWGHFRRLSDDLERETESPIAAGIARAVRACKRAAESIRQATARGRR